MIFLTALNNTEDIVKGFKLGANDYVSKPFNHEELITRVAHHIFIAASKRTILEQSEQLQRTMRNRDRMYSVIAHDLRSPIGTLKMVFNMLTLNITEQMAVPRTSRCSRWATTSPKTLSCCWTTCSSGPRARRGA